MTTYVEEEEELLDIEDDLKSRKENLLNQDKDLRGRERTMEAINDEDFDTLWSMLDGMEITIPHFMTARTLRKRLPDGRRAFTGNKRNAPQWKAGNVLCWLHADHPRRSEWDSMGLAGHYCDAAHLASPWSARIHMQHRHKNSWENIQEYTETQRSDRAFQQGQQQLEATLALARQAAGISPTQTVSYPVMPGFSDIEGVTTTNAAVATTTTTTPTRLTCECGWVTDKGPVSLGAHKRLHCPLRGNPSDA